MTDQAVEDWNGEVGERWLKYLVPFESMISPINASLMKAAAFKPGEQVVEIGSGGGKNVIEIARAVAPSGGVLGVDIAEILIEHSKKRAADAGVDNVDFKCADAQTASLDALRDRAFSSFGIMFFEDPDKAFANIRSWVKPGGDFTFSCWGPPEKNPWIGMVGAIAGKYVEMPEREPDGPGPFRMADPDATKALLERAGWKDVECKLWQGEQLLGGEGATPESAADFVMDALAIGEPLEEAGPGVKDKARADVIEALTPFHKNGSIRLDAAAWIVTAKA
ncbi:class I SAM-dependent methyltransferase [Hyphococcus sp.]|uniref:class I SAM-dependent methyltransferase n=1 Tax=Hyphococcus sp. TaxID=2038636 RepID=UPI0035C720FF